MRTLSATLLVLNFAILGCGGGVEGPATHPVSGTVTFEGKPIAKGSIGFIPVEIEGKPDAVGPDYGLDIVDGKYSGEVSAGEKKVAIYASWPTGETEEGDAGSPDVPVMESLPAKYNTESELTATIKEGANEGLDFKLE